MTLDREVTERRERLHARGYRVIAVRTCGKAPFEAGWRQAAGVPVFNEEGASTGIRCDKLRAVDVDVDDPVMAAEVEALVEKHFGPAPTRFRSNSPRVLAVYRSDRPRLKRTIPLPFHPGSKIEILGDGQQFVAFGEHVSGVPYEWRGVPLDAVPFDDLPLITEEQEEAFERECKSRWPMSAKTAADAPPGANGKIFGFFHHTCIPSDVEAALDALPNDYVDRDKWLKIGMAARAGGASFEAFDRWSQKWWGYDRAHTRATWESFTDIRKITAASLFAEVFGRVPGWTKPSRRPDPNLGPEPGSSGDTNAHARPDDGPADGTGGWDRPASGAGDGTGEWDEPSVDAADGTADGGPPAGDGTAGGDNPAGDAGEGPEGSDEPPEPDPDGGGGDGTEGWDVPPEPEVLPIQPRVLRSAKDILPRRWLYGKAYLRQCVSALVAPGGSGKSIIAMVEALAMAAGRQLLHDRPIRPLKVFYWNLEDPIDEIERRFVGVAQHFGITPEQYEGRLFFESGLNLPLKLASADGQGFTIDEASLDGLEATIVAHGLDVLVIDPVISAHGIPENDNVAVDAVIKALAAVATRANCAILLVHHARKSLAGPARELDAGDARGAAAFVDGCRIVRLVQRMTPDEAKKFGIDPQERWRHMRLVDGKTNHAPPADVSTWIRLDNVPLNNPNADNPDGDHIGVPVRWEARPADTAFPAALVEEIKATVRDGEYRASPQADHWVGYALGPILKLDPEIKEQKARIVGQVRRLVRAGHLQVINRRDKNHEWRDYVVVPAGGSST
ncbi:AAA family ATPase [Bosea sp. NBC_00550]|uniref:AAA family ATPase n=1 Tax=Bosea sp. NBC_00550 TaxID=2969621 RepID=UPI0022322504|nr:AAA family ATPase [Bosea sp. NBC_00550]UZF94460.1 AAA family ATPase [Bosea sp. NBC_00550]